MMRLRLLVPLFVVLIVPAQAAFGYPVSKHQLIDVLDHSAIAVVGRIETVGDGTPVERRRVGAYSGSGSPVHFLLRPAVVRVEVVLKGDGVTPGATVPFSFLWNDPGKPSWYALREYLPGELWMLFLETVDGHLEPLDPLGDLDLRLPDDYRPKEPNYTLPLDRTEAVLAELLRLKPQQLAIPSTGMGRSLIEEILLTLNSGSFTAVMPRRSAEEYNELTVYRAGFVTVDLVRALFELSKSDPNPAVRAMAAAILVRAGSSDAVGSLISAERELTRQGSDRDYGALTQLDQIRDRAYLPVLHQLLSDPDAKFHAPAASALRGIADPSSIPYLVKALDDPSFEVRYFAATGLAAITGESARYLATDSFRAQEAQQIDYWRAWSRARQADTPPQPPGPR